jgi:hypothetical protein
MIVKDIPTVDIPVTLGRWKLAESELVQLRQWSGSLVENPSKSDFLPKWNQMVSQVAARNKQLKESDLTPLIRMIMLAAFEEAQKLQDSDSTAGPNLYKELQEKIRANLNQARQLQALSGSQRSDPLSGSRLTLPAYQRTLGRCEVLTQEKPTLECKEILVTTSYELDDYISASEAQLTRAEQEAKRAGTANSGQERRRQILYALSDAAKMMHDSGVVALRKAGN